MFIERLHIDRFGILREQEVSGLSPGLCLFLGRNEAGKSTCLRFFQSMLFGYKRGNRSLDPMTDMRSKGLAGGALFLRTRDVGPLTLMRRPGTHGGTLSLSGESGPPLDEGFLQRLLGGLTVEVFDNIFAFSLKNLMELAALKGDGVRHALHGAAFGLGLRSPAQALKELDDRMSVLLKRDAASSSAAINNVLRELADVREDLRARTPDLEAYNGIQSRLDALERNLDGLHENRVPKEHSLRRVRRRLAVWRQWEEARRVRDELMGLGVESALAFRAGEDDPGVAGTETGNVGAEAGSIAGPETGIVSEPVFAPDAVQRLEALLAQQEERLVAEREAERACALLRADIASLSASSRLAGLHPAVQSLREQKAHRRDEAGHLPVLIQESAGLALLQERTLARLGPGWDAERIAAADTSVFSKETVLRHGGILAEKEAALVRAEQEKNRLAEELADSARQEESTRQSLRDSLPPDHPLPEKQVAEAIMADRAQARAALAELHRLRERAARAGAEAARALGDIDPAWTASDRERFDGSLSARQRLAGHSAAIAEARSRHAEAKSVLRQAEEAAVLAGEKTAVQEQRCAQYGDLPDSLALETRHGLLRRIERLSIELAAARRDYEAASGAVREREESFRAGGAKRLAAWPHNPFALACALLFLAGLGCVGAVVMADATLFLYAGAGLSALAFAACLLCRISPSRREPDQADEAALRYALSLAESRRRILVQGLAGLAAKASPWLSAASPGEPGEADIERALRLLETQAQKLALLERDRQELFSARQAQASAQERLARAAEEEIAAAETLASSLNAWQEHMASMKLSPGMRPEAAAGIFDRVATARACAAVALEAEKSVALALRRITVCLREAGGIPFFAAFLEQADAGASAPGAFAGAERAHASSSGAAWDEDSALRQSLSALDKALAAWRRHEEEEQERRGLESVLKERTDNRARAEQRLARAGELWEAAGIALDEARKDWEQWLAGFGFAPGLSPRGAAEALDAMLAFLDREKDRLGKEALRAGMARGLESFVRETARLAEAAGLERIDLDALAPALDHGLLTEAAQQAVLSLVPSALQTLDGLSAGVEAAVRARNRLAEKEEQLANRSRDLLRAKTALELTRENLAALLAGAGAPDAEHFRAAFARFRRVEELRAGERSLLAGMRGLAAEEGENPADLLASLERSSLDDLKEEESRLCEDLAGLERETRDLSVERGQLLERRDALAGGGGSGPLLQREAVLREDLRRLSRQWSVLALARDFLLAAKTRFEEEGQQGVIRFAGDLFSAITDGEYTGIAASLEGDAFMAVHRSGDRRDPEKQLSQGAREQLYLALRLAYIKNHAAKAEPLPVIMDDILVNFDPVRAANTARVLAEFARDNQLLFFTCHPGTVDTLLQAAAGQKPVPAVYSVSKGEIRPHEAKSSG